MPEIEYTVPLEREGANRLRVRATKAAGRIVEFVVQYEALAGGTWHAVVRYDTAHGFVHRDELFPDGRHVKMPLPFANRNLAFTFASLDLKARWREYRARFDKKEALR
jgi:hypothetical protein